MIPRNLAIFMLSGAAAGAVFGLVIYSDDHDTLRFVQGPSLSFTTDKASYRTGEIVTLQLVNTGTTPIFFTGTSYGIRIVQLDSIPVTSFPDEPVATVLEPQQTHTLQWNQIKMSTGEPVQRGAYKAVSEGLDQDGEKISASIVINIQ